ncbi:hypothetical protein PIB30_056296 [Stylosanthes scabra]|uniref:Uncharacterized protein n=1 Tax=Stylosanthes scabra TaxID=79078 RepID=A0ABU6XJ60_9FABA|nr:hypothetical protein [Stylosanthes scabra]
MDSTFGGGGGDVSYATTLYTYSTTINTKPSSIDKRCPPLTAIDRFLCNQHDEEAHNNDIIAMNNNNIANVFADENYLCGEFMWPNYNEESSFFDGLFLANDEKEALKWRSMPHQNPTLCMKENVPILNKSAKGSKATEKVSNSSGWIKGTWAEEEDRNLIELVKQYGERKWAQIAEKLDGRSGKQCRERWNNHLRPDIKKTSWSEEEERMLVERHAKVGNRWAVIAKCIPGRTENDYIRSKTNTTTTTVLSEEPSRDSVSNNDELLFMEQVFNHNNNNDIMQLFDDTDLFVSRDDYYVPNNNDNVTMVGTKALT